MAEAPTSDGGTGGGVSDMALIDIKEPGDADVLCGRGGAALRHPGNQTYRRLVNLNKGLYITCLKTEKLKISRSIVAAIREQKGRFLEKDNKKETWYDIGDKKAIEKTSQALREGQPKLRQKIVEMGGGPAGTAAFMESQYGHPGLYNPDQVGMAQTTLDRATSGASATNGNGVAMPGAMAAAHAAQQQSLQQEMQQGNNGNTSQHDFDSAMLQRLSIHSHAEENPAATLLQQQARLRPSLTTRSSVCQELGIAESQLSLMSEFSAFNGSVGTLTNESLMSIETSYRRALNMSQNTHNQSVAGSQFSLDQFSIGTSTNSVGINSSINTFNSGNGTNASANAFGGASGTNVMAAPPTVHPKPTTTMSNQKRDRRRDFARMKFQRPPSARNPGAARREPASAATMASSSSQRSFGDGMPDIHMVESTLSLHSTASNMSGVEGARGKDSENKPAVAVESVKLSDGPGDRRERMAEGLGSGSRHSIMSGLSRISDSSIDHSIFSDLSRKIGDVSTRSLAMSEISAIDIQEREDEDTTGPRPNGAPSFDGHPLETTPGYRKTQPAMDFDL